MFCTFSNCIICYNKVFEELIFEVAVKSVKTAKFIVLENFPLYGINQTH